MTKIFDITAPINPQLKVWQGDTSFSKEVLLDLSRGDVVTLSTVHTTVHLGTHVDAPSHYGLGGETVGEMSLEYFIGKCQVISVDAKRGQEICQDDIKVNITAERVLFSTGTFPDPTKWNDDFAGLSPELIDYLRSQGVILIGVDTPSVDLLKNSSHLPVHRKALAHKIAILEGVRLENVPDGVYELIALPLKMMDSDGSPVRAILRDMRGGF